MLLGFSDERDLNGIMGRLQTQGHGHTQWAPCCEV